MSKPLGIKAYGSIPHLPESRLGPSDSSCHHGQYRICCHRKRDKHDRIIVTEKLDGSCMSVAKFNGRIIALGRSGHYASTSPFEHIREFQKFVTDNKKRFDAALEEGQRFVGEWLNVATGTIYELPHEPFVIFDLMTNQKRHSHDEMTHAASIGNFKTAYVVSDGEPITIEKTLDILGGQGFHGAQEIVEGAVWRVERKGIFDFMAKFVHSEKIDGKYLKGLHDNEEYIPNIINEHN